VSSNDAATEDPGQSRDWSGFLMFAVFRPVVNHDHCSSLAAGEVSNKRATSTDKMNIVSDQCFEAQYR